MFCFRLLISLKTSLRIQLRNGFFFFNQAVWVFSLIDYEPPTFHNGAYEYPWWAEAIGWGIASLSLICLPAFAIYVLIRSDGVTFSEVVYIHQLLLSFGFKNFDEFVKFCLIKFVIFYPTKFIEFSVTSLLNFVE